VDDINQIRNRAALAKREERRASNDLHNHKHRADHEQSQLETCLTYKKECLNGLKTAKDSGLSVVQIRECQLLVQYLDSVVETRQYKADISQENYKKAEVEWQETHDSMENLKQELHKLEEENNDEIELIDDNRLSHKQSYKVYKRQK
jgi:flagellar biosynthesis chaperone FliJ